MKWLKIAGISAILLAIIPIILIIFTNFIHIYPFMYSEIITLISTIILFIGFFFIGKYAKNKFLKITDLFLIAIILINGILYLGYGILFDKAISLPKTIGLIYGFVPIILYFLLSIALFRVKEIKLAKTSGAAILIYYCLITNPGLRLFVFPNPINTAGIILQTILILSGLISFSILAIMFFKASKQFEPNN